MAGRSKESPRSAKATLRAVQPELNELLARASADLQVPGAVVGITWAGEEDYAFHVVSSVGNPQPVVGFDLGGRVAQRVEDR